MITHSIALTFGSLQLTLWILMYKQALNEMVLYSLFVSSSITLYNPAFYSFKMPKWLKRNFGPISIKWINLNHYASALKNSNGFKNVFSFNQSVITVLLLFNLTIQRKMFMTCYQCESVHSYWRIQTNKGRRAEEKNRMRCKKTK